MEALIGNRKQAACITRHRTGRQPGNIRIAAAGVGGTCSASPGLRSSYTNTPFRLLQVLDYGHR